MNLTKGAAIRLTIIFILLGLGGAYSRQIMLNPASLEVRIQVSIRGIKEGVCTAESTIAFIAGSKNSMTERP